MERLEPKSGLTEAQAEAIDQVVARLREERGWARFVSLSYLLNSWREFVVEVAGYEGPVEEYWNDLDSRNLLEDVLGELPAQLRSHLSEVLLPWDERFRRATVPAPGFWAYQPRAGGVAGWWNDRKPSAWS